MAKHRLIQTNFTAGELSPRLASRIDLSKYFNGVETLENFIVFPHGGAQSRAGTRFVAEAKHSDKKCRLIPFEFSTEQAYIIEAGDLYMRFFKNGGQIGAPDANTKLLLHMNGIDASQIFTDNGSTGHPITAVGSAQIDTAYKKFSTGSGLFNGSTDALSIVDHTDFDLSGNVFTIDCWIRCNSISSSMTIYFQGDNNSNYFWLRTTVGGGISVQIANTAVSGFNTVTGLIAVDTWYHIEVVGDGTNFYIFIAGEEKRNVLIASYPAIQNYSANPVQIGRYYDGSINTVYFDGRIDEFRLSDVARHTADFTPQTSEYLGLSGTPYEIVSPYLEADLPNIKFVQSADVLYLVHENYIPRKLSRLGDTNWILAEIQFRPPPSYEEPVDIEEGALTPGAATGLNINFTLSGSTVGFMSADVGRSIVYGASRAIIITYNTKDSIQCDIIDDFPDTDPIAQGSWFMTGTIFCTVNPSHKNPVGKLINLTASSPGTGFRSLDVGKFMYIHGGLVEIITFIDLNSLQGIIRSELDESTSTTDFTIEAPAWDAILGYPRAISFFEDRLFFGGNLNQPDTLWGSVSGDYENFTRGANDDQGVVYTLLSNQVNVIQWMEPTRVLFAGTLGGEFRISGGDGPLTPSNVDVKSETTYGSNRVRAVRIENAIFFVQKAGRKLRALGYKFESDAYDGIDVSILAEHITSGGILDMSYQQELNSTLWVIRNDGVLLGFTYQKDHDVSGWHRHITQGFFESVATIPNPDGLDDQTWVSVQRDIDGATKRYIEYFDERGIYYDRLNLDCAFIYDGAEIINTTDLAHLEGKAVRVIGDGAVFPDNTVTGGALAIDLDTAVSKLEIGLAFTPQMKTMRPDIVAQAGAGTIQSLNKSWSELYVRFYESLGGTINGEVIEYRDREDTMDAPPDLFTGDKDVNLVGIDKEGQITIIQDQSLPMTILSITGVLDIGED